MNAPLRIDVGDLKRAAQLLLDHASSVEGEVLELDHDMFWSVPAPALYDVYEQPADLTIGQLTESWNNVAAMIHGDTPPRSLGLVWLSDVLRAAGHKIVR